MRKYANLSVVSPLVYNNYEGIISSNCFNPVSLDSHYLVRRPIDKIVWRPFTAANIVWHCYFNTGDDEDDDSVKKEEREKKRLEEEESLFQRLEESRLMLEQELGIDKFLRVYKFLQVTRNVTYHFLLWHKCCVIIHIRELKQWRRRRQGRSLAKNGF